VEEEADECLFWLEYIVESGMMPENKLSALITEYNEIVAMIVASLKSLRQKSPDERIN
jgi:four helix bundle protein